MKITEKQKKRLLVLIADWIAMEQRLIFRSQAQTVQVLLSKLNNKQWEVELYVREDEDANSGFLNLADMEARGVGHSWTNGVAYIRDFRIATQVAILMKCLE